MLFITSFDPETLIPWTNEILVTSLQGISKMYEVLFYHCSSKVLMMSDLLVNLHNQMGRAKIFLMMCVAHNKFGIDRAYMMRN